MGERDLRDDPCEYGCAGRCESLEHWRDRAEYLAQAARNLAESCDAWHEECWQILLATGADPDEPDLRHLRPGEALKAVKALREVCEDAYDAGWRGATNAIAEAQEADRG